MSRQNLSTPTLAAYFAGNLPDAIGFRANGLPIFGIAGGADDDPPADPPQDPAPDLKPAEYTPPATQADLDRIIGERVGRERGKYADYADLKAKAEAHDAALEAAKTDAEKAVDAARSEGEKSALATVNDRLIKAETRVLASAARFRDPADAVIQLDLSDVKVGDDGEVDGEAIKAKLDTLAAAKSYLIDDGKKPAPKPDPTQGGGGADDKASVSRGREMFDNRRGAPKKAS